MAILYSYDQASRMTLVTEGGDELAQYAYDQLGRRTSMVLSSRSAASNTVSYGYEADSALDVLAHQLSGTSNDVVWHFDYNHANQVVLRTLDNPAYQYTPSAAKSESYTPNGLNQYTQIVKDAVPSTLSYDANGNLTSDGVWTYTYDTENRLLTASDGSTSVSYTYDPLGRRVSKDVNGSVTLYLSDGVEEVLELSASGSIQRRYVYGPGVDEPIVMWEGSGVANSARRFYRADHQGSIVALTNQDGVLQERYTYDAYGAPDNPGGQPIRYTGRRWDAETGLYYYRARYYSPALGRFLHTDPVGYDAGPNLYVYLDNDPVNFTDPTGEIKLEVGVEFTLVVGIGGSGGFAISFDTENLELGGKVNVSLRTGLEGGLSIPLDVEPSSTATAQNSISQQTVLEGSVSLGPVSFEKDFVSSKGNVAEGDLSGNAGEGGVKTKAAAKLGLSVGLEERVEGTTSVVSDAVEGAQDIVGKAKDFLEDKFKDFRFRK